MVTEGADVIVGVAVAGTGVAVGTPVQMIVASVEPVAIGAALLSSVIVPKSGSSAYVVMWMTKVPSAPQIKSIVSSCPVKATPPKVDLPHESCTTSVLLSAETMFIEPWHS